MQMLVGRSVTDLKKWHNSVNFHARTSRFCMEVDLDNDDDDDDNNDDDDDNEDDYSRFRVIGHNSPKNNFLGLKPKNELFLCKNTTYFLGWSWNFNFFDGDDDFGDDDENEYSCNLANFQARTSRFCMEVDLDNIL